MSELPVIDATKLAKKIMSEVSELTYQKFQLELLAESLRDERDQARNDRDQARKELSQLLTQISESTPTAPVYTEGDIELETVDESVLPIPDEVFNITSVDEDVR